MVNPESESAKAAMPGETAAGRGHERGARVYYEGRPSWINFWKSLFVAAAAIGAGVWFWSEKDNLWILFGALVYSLAVHGYIVAVRSMSLYLVTPRRVEFIYGLFTKSSNEVRIRDIRTINVRKSGFKGLLGVGSVEFSSAGGDGAEVVFRDVWAAQRVKALVRGLQDGSESSPGKLVSGVGVSG